MSKKITFNADKITSFVTAAGVEYTKVTRVRTNTEGVRFKEVSFEPNQQHIEALRESRKAYDKDYL